MVSLCVFLAMVISTDVVVGFAPRVSLLAEKRGGVMRLQLKEEDLMTSQDEEILFGEKNSAREGAPFEAGRQRKVSRVGNLLESSNLPINELDHSPNDPLINALRKTRDTVTSCPGIWKDLSRLCPEKRAILDTHLCDETVDLTFGEMEETVRKSAAVFAKLGVQQGDNVAILGENSAKWLIVDHGVQSLGGATAVRGADAPADELRYIYEHSDSAGIVVMQGPKLLKRLAADTQNNNVGGGALGLSNAKYGPVKTVVLLHKEKQSLEQIAELEKELGIQVKVFSELLSKTKPLVSAQLPQIKKEDLATIVYTSGTTGSPKGVMLTHGNLLHQINHRLSPTLPYDDADPIPGETMLSLLPVWHITERTFELWILSRGCNVVYSTIRTFKNDLAKYQPQWMVLVPRVLEKVALGVQNKFANGSAVAKKLVSTFTATSTARATNLKTAKGLVVGDAPPSNLKKIKAQVDNAALAPLNALGDKLVWSKVKDGFGGKLKLIISGGSALAGNLESFYETAGIPIVVGYGLTECSPLISFRRSDANLVTPGCVGKPTLDTEIRVVDPEDKPEFAERKSLPDGMTGVVIARGPQVMRGYYKNPEATGKAIDRYGWFDTGDLGKVNPATGDIVLTGRQKDTIVLSNGENIEPSPIEDAILTESNLIEQIMLAGQDGRKLIAIAVLNPNELVSAGYLDEQEGNTLQKIYEKVNDPKCTQEECESESVALQKASQTLRSNQDLTKALVADMKKATKVFRPWEQVADVYITVEPFAMANGLLTQSYKVKRDFVMKRYGDEL
eukprot:CAMPEP_0195509018 /NCGR_PEP_ID=MMETSP0794_2-20130614/2071_1 /TAXON_ID=515487 /ORGANISM="Stephanopyxis turris, Strain CCMP 815" /LENGTH=789 /DNA_ID=CAMNT_0040636129 /DNA_START=62 /DNA_END=2431 /DNA_ORIENTATION=-